MEEVDLFEWRGMLGGEISDPGPAPAVEPGGPAETNSSRFFGFAARFQSVVKQANHSNDCHLPAIYHCGPTKTATTDRVSFSRLLYLFEVIFLSCSHSRRHRRIGEVETTADWPLFLLALLFSVQST